MSLGSLLSVIALLSAASPAQQVRDSAEARRLWHQALELRADLDFDGALELLRAAKRTDQDFLPAHFTYIEMMRLARATDALRQEYPNPPADNSALSACLSTVTASPTGHEAGVVERLLDLERTHGTDDCSTLYVSRLAPGLTPESAWQAVGLKYQAEAVRRLPEVGEAWATYATALARSGAWQQASEVLERGVSQSAGVLAVLDLHMLRYHLLRQHGDTVRAAALLAAISSAVARDGRKGLRWWYLSHLMSAHGSDPAFPLDSAHDELSRIARSAGAWFHEWDAAVHYAYLTMDYRGNPSGALAGWDRAVALSDSVQRGAMELETYVRRGRARAKVGRLVDAERDLLHAIGIRGAREHPFWLAEAYHNLAHVYEGAGHLAGASVAADSFIALTRPLRHVPIRMMSLRDAGLIRWKAGWHASADAAFREMVSVVEETDREQYWAGEYFERTGDLERALHYYRTSIARQEGEQSLSLAGAVRVYEMLGRLDSAEAAARAHDGLNMGMFDNPMVPRVLARLGRIDEAAEIWRAWAEKRTADGNVQAAAQTRLYLADLLYNAARIAEAEAEAKQAEAQAAGLNLTDELIWARRVQGRARLRMGDAEGGLSLLKQAAEMATAHPTSDGILATQLALADGLAEVGRHAAALPAYDRAARAVEQVTARWSQDLDRAGYRDRQLAPFDGALRVLITTQTLPHRLDSVAAWSARRKAAALALSAPTSPAEGDGEWPARIAIDALQRRLSEGEALLDYIVVDSTVAVLVVTRRAAEVIRLPVSADSIRHAVEKLRRPLITTYAGRIDLARAPFDLNLAASLYRALLAPVERFLAGSRRLIVAPDGPLHYVPFDALVVEAAPAAGPAPVSAAERYRRAVYAIDRFEIAYVPSAQFVGALSQSVQSAKVLAVTRAAPGGARELSVLSAAWPPERMTVLAEARATETAARLAAGRADVLHFAVHAEANDQDPQASHLRLGPDDRNDGYFHLGEIAGERRRAGLVVLSACETQAGRLFNGEGLMGLARAFLASGAAAVVATQWPVGPSAAELMGEFYRRLAAGDAPPAALRSARLAMRNVPGTGHPFHWAGFVLVAGAVRSNPTRPAVAGSGTP
ncbi:MAG: CHAT domain-containing protein [Gemmatimonadetes bacterium]|nr:CHAT domain-containing protein [Gemmatimonadota bacterium]